MSTGQIFFFLFCIFNTLNLNYIQCVNLRQQDMRSVLDFLGLNSLISTYGSNGNKGMILTYPNLSAYRTHDELLKEMRSWLDGTYTLPRTQPNRLGVWNNIPERFVIPGQGGQKYVSFKTSNGKYLSCSNNGDLTTSPQLTVRSFFIPEDLGSGRIGIKSAVSGYLNYNGSKITCNANSSIGNGGFTLMMTPGPNSTNHGDYPNYLLLRQNEGGFLGLNETGRNEHFYVDSMRSNVMNYLFGPAS